MLYKDDTIDEVPICGEDVYNFVRKLKTEIITIDPPYHTHRMSQTFITTTYVLNEIYVLSYIWN